MSIADRISPEWIESQFRLWQQAPELVSPQWRAFFEGFELGCEEAPETGRAPARKQAAVQSLIYRYRDIGHLLACTNPLDACPTAHPLLDLAAFGLTEADLDRTFDCPSLTPERQTLREILDGLRETYCRSIGVEYMHIQDPEERHWLRERLEGARNRAAFSRQEKRRILRRLYEAALFENFLHRKYLGQKRFSLEGSEAVIPLLDHLVQKAAHDGVRDIVFGTTHRGRLNIMANILGKPLENIFGEFEDNVELGFVGEGDVKYHKGFSADLDHPGGGTLHMTMAANPSHLESVDPVVEGKARARQDAYGEAGAERVLPVLVHGDAAFAGQGMVAETLNLSQLEGFGTGGSVHIVINNQIGFTTVPEDARSSRYATDVTKMLMMPIFHVHGDDPEAVVHAAGLALDYRRRFGRDVILEVIGYRRHGHNEGDEPYFTQPLMYEKIKNHPPVQEIYTRQLREEGLAEAEVAELREGIEARLERAVERRGQAVGVGFQGKWEGIQREYAHPEVETGVDEARLRELGTTITAIPEGFHPHKKIAKLFGRHREAVAQGAEIDWPLAEALAFASLLNEGRTVRMSGQDSRRGTFNQRHAVLYDVKTGATCSPLAAAARDGAAFRIFDSTLSEASILGFEYGYSLDSPRDLIVWEAQFGDFANGAQVIIDQYLVSSETKWDRTSGLCLFLPHGYEGQGPEHSSARIERFLQACAGNNLIVANPSTPAQFFHLLRRQVLQPFRRPLVVFTPKSLLRLPACRSPLAEFAAGRFREVLPPAGDPAAVRSVVFCSGKIYYDLLQRRDEEERDDVALIRVEQLYPLRTDLLREAVAPLEQVERVAWVQEEPQNMGAWSFIRPRLAELLGREPRYIGRDAAAAPAVGSHKQHQQEQQEILDRVFAPED